jgi:hypothetical protein
MGNAQVSDLASRTNELEAGRLCEDGKRVYTIFPSPITHDSFASVANRAFEKSRSVPLNCHFSWEEANGWSRKGSMRVSVVN